MIQYNIETLNRLKVGDSVVTYDGTSEVHSKEISTPSGSSLNWNTGYSKSIASVVFDKPTSELRFTFNDTSTTVVELGIEQVTTEDITAIGIGSIGGIADGTVIPTGSNLEDFIKQLVRKRVAASYTQPTLTVSGGLTGVHESGSTVSPTYTATFTQHDAGAFIKHKLTYPSGIIEDTINPKAFNFSVTSTTNVTVQFEVEYAQGPIKNDNLGDPSPIGRIEAGTKTVSKTIKFGLYSFYGPGDATTNQQVRALTGTASTKFTLNTGSTENKMTLAIPVGNNLVSIIDLDALNLNLTGNYTLVNGNFTLTLPDGSTSQYKLYQLSLAAPYSSSHRHSITIN